MWYTENIRRLLHDFAGKVTRRPFAGSADMYAITEGDWKDDLGLDSIQLMELAAEVNSFFCLFEIKDPPYLLSFHRIEDWVAQILLARQRWDEGLHFHSSGTTGSSKIIRHNKTFLEREIRFLAHYFREVQTIIPFVPSYTIYGFLFTIWLPEKLSAKVCYPSATDWKNLSPNSLVVGTPFHWHWLLSLLPEQELPFLGVSSGAPLSPSLFSKLLQKGIRLTEIYGATETAGVAFRQQPQESFGLFPYWQLLAEGADSRIADLDTGDVYSLMDKVMRSEEGGIAIMGRKDNQVNIAGVLVNTEHIAAIINKMPNVAHCQVSAKSMNQELFIQAFIQLHTDTDAARTQLQKQIDQQLPAPEKPRFIHFTQA